MKQSMLICGADGFIGSHLVELLVKTGYKVRAFCIYNSIGSWGWLDALSVDIKENLEVVLGDVRDPISVREAMRGCDLVFHLAALIAIPYSYIAPSSYIDTNIHGTLNVVQAAKDLGITRVIHTSTSETYGTAQFVRAFAAESALGEQAGKFCAIVCGHDSLASQFPCTMVPTCSPASALFKFSGTRPSMI